MIKGQLFEAKCSANISQWASLDVFMAKGNWQGQRH